MSNDKLKDLIEKRKKVNNESIKCFIKYSLNIEYIIKKKN